MATFFALFHSAAFLKSRLSSISPALDLNYLSMMHLYKEENPAAAKIAIESVLKHLWYLTEEVVVLSIFDRKLDPVLRKGILMKLLFFPRPQTFAPGKPKFPSLRLNSIITYLDQLLNFVGSRSWLLFVSLKLTEENFDWMHTEVENWEKMSGYKKTEGIVRSFEVVNDCAERAIKLISDFKDVVVNVKDQEYLFQVIEDPRNYFRSFKKSSLKDL
ncbi:hypothetical protein GHT06_019076 [Daphnia sinensis]|uniref:Uncharacterized protein n=1 Tax=Daphnia sinensis TaxID=1820382 RepID=A0AAD5L175_9CRUS|nr:hypothetical protein GHT06_019076 [Daphnia sinensis]